MLDKHIFVLSIGIYFTLLISFVNTKPIDDESLQVSKSFWQDRMLGLCLFGYGFIPKWENLEHLATVKAIQISDTIIKIS